MRLRALCPVLAWFALATTGAAAQESTGTPPLSQRASLARSKGIEHAPVFVYEFADFQCPHCARFALEVFPRIDSAFVKPGRVRWVFVHLPLPTNTNSWAAHEAAACAGGVADRFWAMHDRLFGAQAEWANSPDPGAVFLRLAREIGVPRDAFLNCTMHDRAATLLLGDVIFAATSRVSGTPAFIINNELTVMGLKSFEEWREILEKVTRRQD
jgi:protein-disulfide isomerase